MTLQTKIQENKHGMRGEGQAQNDMGCLTVTTNLSVVSFWSAKNEVFSKTSSI